MLSSLAKVNPQKQGHGVVVGVGVAVEVGVAVLLKVGV